MSELTLRGVWPTVKTEWDSRTWYGKLWFPVWLAWTGYLAFGEFSLIVSMYFIIGFVRGVLAVFGTIRQATPEVYHD